MEIWKYEEMDRIRLIFFGILLFLVSCDDNVSVMLVTPDVAIRSVPSKGIVPDNPVLPNLESTLRAFPGAEGFGAYASGGRSGRVVKVLNLNADGAGSLQAALNQYGPRIIVFDVSGIIEGDIHISNGDVTIAGQTAPGAGITIHGRLKCEYKSKNIIIRHIRVRADHRTNPGVQGSQYDGLQCSTSANLIFDHISVSGGVDESFDLFEATNVTVQWSTITRSDDADNHNFGLLNGPDGNYISVHHNLFAHNSNRNPAIANGPAEIINNVIYNVDVGFTHHNPAKGSFNIIGNYYKQGPNASLSPFYFDDESFGAGSPTLIYYLADNYIDDPGDYVGSIDSPWKWPFKHGSFRFIDSGWGSINRSSQQKHSFDGFAVTVDGAQQNYATVLDKAGAFPRDKMAIDDINEVKNRSGHWGARIPDNLLLGLNPGVAPLDTDNDGLPDSWENANDLSIFLSDHNTVMPSGYTAIEEYINGLADKLLDGGQ